MTERDSAALPLLGAGLVAGAAVLGFWAWMPRDKRPRTSGEPMLTTRHEPIWPIPFSKLTQIGDSIVAHRPGSGRAHKGVDLFTEAGTEVRAAAAGRVLRVVDGSKGSTDSQQRAGLFVDIKTVGDRIYRYLHLGRATVKQGQRIKAGEAIGTVASTGTSGVLRSSPHLHFEIRDGDFDHARGDYGTPINPLTVLPLRLGASNGLG